MPDPMKTLSDAQMAWLDAWMNASRQGLTLWKHWVEMQSKLVNQAAQFHRDHIEIATGASFTDRYGKRAHDIDPERDV